MVDFEWISEGDRLPKIGQNVMIALPDQFASFWRVSVARLLVRHEDVYPMPVQAGSGKWPVDYYWAPPGRGRDTSLITGNGWWAAMDRMNLPPLAGHGCERGYHFVVQTAPAFTPKDGKAKV